MNARLTATAQAPFARLMMVGALALLLQAPSCMIGQLGKTRQQSRDDATADIARTWGGRQDLLGPFLVVPYRFTTTDNKGHKVEQYGSMVVLPESLDIQTQPAVETRSRGLFEVPVFRATVRLAGRFRAPKVDANVVLPHDARIDWPLAYLVMRLADVHALDRAAPLQWGSARHDFEPGGGVLCAAGVHAALPALSPDAPAAFAIELDLRGSDGLRFAPLGRETTVAIRSGWPHPAFQGAWLPRERTVTADGFSARWQVTDLARGLPSAWPHGAIGDAQLMPTLFGVDLLQPVDPYRMTERSLKYDLLFTGLAFLAVWLFEVLAQRPVHPVQYVLLGAGLCLFYLLELSLAEQLGFGWAYGIAAGAVTAQVSLYARAALRGRGAAAILFAAVGSLYGLLYVLLREEDYALLVGSFSLFVGLSVVMFLTRRVQWSAPSGEAKPGQ
jgi:inner membrane protein